MNDDSNNNNNTQLIPSLDVYRVNSYKTNCRKSTIQARLTALPRNNIKDNSLKATLGNITVKKNLS
jgi:hypothetical protein